MDSTQALHAYRTLDPAGWVAAYRLLPVWAGLALMALGVALMLFGGGRIFRAVAGPLGLLIGTLWGGLVVTKLSLPFPEGKASMIAGALLAVLGFAFPPGVVFFAVGVPLGLFVGELAGAQDWPLGFVPAFLVGGALAAVFQRYIAAVVSSIAGAWGLVLGLLAALHPVGTLSAAVASQPVGVLIAAGLFATAGAVYQLAVRPSPEEAQRLAAEKAKARKRLEEKRALEERWANYSSGRGKDP